MGVQHVPEYRLDATTVPEPFIPAFFATPGSPPGSPQAEKLAGCSLFDAKSKRVCLIDRALPLPPGQGSGTTDLAICWARHSRAALTEIYG